MEAGWMEFSRMGSTSSSPLAIIALRVPSERIMGVGLLGLGFFLGVS